MEFKIRNLNLAKYMQEGGVAPEAASEAAAPEAPAQDPQAQLLAACQQALDSQDCQIAMQVCAAIIQMMGGGGAPQENAQPVYKKGGKLVRWQFKH